MTGPRWFPLYPVAGQIGRYGYPADEWHPSAEWLGEVRQVASAARDKAWQATVHEDDGTETTTRHATQDDAMRAVVVRVREDMQG